MLIRRGLALLGSLALGGALLGSTGCGGGLSTGEHVFYWVALESAPPEASCYSGDKIPVSVKDDLTTVRDRGTFVLYATADDVVQLDIGSAVLVGTETDAGYSFQGDTTDVESPPGTKITDADKDGISDTMDSMIDADADGVDDNVDQDVDTDADGLDDRGGQDDLVDKDGDGVDDRYTETPSGITFTSTTSVTVDIVVDGTAISGTVTSLRTKKCAGVNCPKDFDTSCSQTNIFSGVQIEQTEVHVAGEEKASNTP